MANKDKLMEIEITEWFCNIIENNGTHLDYNELREAIEESGIVQEYMDNYDTSKHYGEDYWLDIWEEYDV